MKTKYWMIGVNSRVPKKNRPKWIKRLIKQGYLKDLGGSPITDIWGFKVDKYDAGIQYLYDGDCLVKTPLGDIGIIPCFYKKYKPGDGKLLSDYERKGTYQGEWCD